MKDYLLFRRMLSPVIIQLIFWVLIVLLIMGGVRELFVPEHLWKGIQVLILGPIVARLACELLLIFFRIDATLTDIKTKLSK